ncbi:MAG: MoxR family ATPase [Anaerolineaceae bacterium]|nr:MoxR family ATPase [Anaerolineaceae bacterium]
MFDFSSLYRKKGPLAEDGLAWLRGDVKMKYPAIRNRSGIASVSSTLVRALLSALDGQIVEALSEKDGSTIHARVRSKSKRSRINRCGVERHTCYFYPFAETSTTKLFGVVGILQALKNPRKAFDFLNAYHTLLSAYQMYGKGNSVGPALVEAQDELYYWIRYWNHNPVERYDRANLIKTANSSLAGTPTGMTEIDLSILTDVDKLTVFLDKNGIEVAGLSVPEEPATKVSQPAESGFVGWQARVLAESLEASENSLLAGPTGTGKTMLVQQEALKAGYDFTVIEGKEGMIDLDFLGAILPQKDGSRKWIDGPLLRAMRIAQTDRALLFFDEINRIPRVHANLLIGLLNQKSGDVCRSMGLDIDDDDYYFVVEVPMTSELVWCPVQHLRFVAAGNFGRNYAVYDLDPALRRRFETVLEFDYLDFEKERALVEKVTGLRSNFSKLLCKLAAETRRMMSNGELQGCIDTASLINWAKKCVRMDPRDVPGVMAIAKLTWADQVCGRDHTGKVNDGTFKGLTDFANTIGR